MVQTGLVMEHRNRAYLRSECEVFEANCARQILLFLVENPIFRHMILFHHTDPGTVNGALDIEYRSLKRLRDRTESPQAARNDADEDLQ